MALHEDFKAARIAAGISQSTLADILMIPQPRLSELESGRSRRISVSLLNQWANILDMDVRLEIADEPKD